MYAHIKGTLATSTPSFVILDVSGIGYKISITPMGYSKLPQVGETVFLYTSFVLRENHQAMYGFLTEEERDIFEVLIQINGIGPKLALCIVGHLSLTQLRGAIAKGDVATISKVPGIGKKTAERLIVEMRGKFPQGESEPLNTIEQDLSTTLVNLGYPQAKADQIAKKVAKGRSEGDLSLMIREALQLVK